MFFNDERNIYEGLTRHNYFPNQKNSKREMPPCFTTRQFTPEIVDLITSQRHPINRNKIGYDQVEYLITRYNNVPRSMGLIHPAAYAFLSKHISENWEEIKDIKNNENSMIKPDFHNDGRIMIMNYGSSFDESHEILKDSFGKRFKVNSDIANCFHSIYSHSIPWAILGFEEAKRQLTQGNIPWPDKSWDEKLDIFIRKSKRNETQGITIGPATSSIIVEIVLSKIDSILRENNFTFRRYIDDYTCYCGNHEEAMRFVQILGKELTNYKLNINLHKTKIVELPEPTKDDWVSELSNSLPSTYINEDLNKRKLTKDEVFSFLDKAVRLNKTTPDGSVINYAVCSVIYDINNQALPEVIDYVLNLSWHYPILLPYLDHLLSLEGVNAQSYAKKINEIINLNAIYGRSDGMAWPLYYALKHDIPISDDVSLAVIESKDCVAISCLHATNHQTNKIIEFTNSLIDKTEYEKDQYWLLLYQLFKNGHIDNPYEEDNTFQILKDNDVDFMPDENSRTLAEGYCEYLSESSMQRLLTNNEDNYLTFEEWKNSQ